MCLVHGLLSVILFILRLGMSGIDRWVLLTLFLLN